ncbi:MULTISPECIES: hypothetical protein [Pectobacterium]|nr:hypothetical protein [Pectobacterium brasiliense]WJM80334.1 hypothetical protein QTI90_18930 [Pectobacterium brasiliense]
MNAQGSGGFFESVTHLNSPGIQIMAMPIVNSVLVSPDFQN